MVNTLNKFEDTIGIFPNALSKDFCRDLINTFESDEAGPLKSQGQTINGVDTNYKNTLDTDLCVHEVFNRFAAEITFVSNDCIDEYIWKWDNQADPIYNSVLLFGEGTHYPIWNMQKYKKGEGHYNSAHVEALNGFPPGEGRSYRILTSMFYLNDVEEGGETKFPYSNLSFKPKAGTFLCWPAGWPWVHLGATPLSSDKYIVTSWLQGNWGKKYEG